MCMSPFLGYFPFLLFHSPSVFCFYQVNPLTTDDAIWHRLTLAACYQLAQSVLKIGFALAKRRDRGRWAGFSAGCHAHGSCLAGCSKALVGTGWTISHLVSINRLRNHSSPLVGAPFLDL